MSDESDKREAERGRLASEVLANPVYTEAYGLIEQGIINRWRDSKDKDEREQLHKLLGLLAQVRRVMEATMRSGEVAKKELERKASLRERIGARFARS